MNATNQQLPITTPLGELTIEAELRRRELGTSPNHALSFYWDDVFESYMLDYGDISIFMGKLN